MPNGYMHSSNFQMMALSTPSGGEHVTQDIYKYISWSPLSECVTIGP